MMNKVFPVFEIWLLIAVISSGEDNLHIIRNVPCEGMIEYCSTCDDGQGEIDLQYEDNKDKDWTYSRMLCVPTSTDSDNTIFITNCECTCETEDKCLKATKVATSDGTAATFTTSKATPNTMVTLPSTNGEAKTTPCPNSTTVTVLGALVGLLVVLLAIVSSSLVWTCWIMRTKQKMKITSEQPR